MLFKVALRNIRRSVKDYAIYFVTLLIAITVFYAFNSITDQQVMTEIDSSGKSNIVEFTGYMMGLFSGVIAFVLGFLVIYANQLLIRRRKREFGMYFTLGMTPGHVSRIILYETVLVGFVSLALGLVCGVLLSQLLSFATAALFAIPMPDYQFTFSMHAFVMTLLCFVAIYVVVALFNVVSIRRCKLIDLLNADAKNQKVAIRNPWICLALFIVSLVMLGVAYWQLKLNGMVLVGDDHFMLATGFMLAGTLLLFFSLSGFIIAVVTRVRSFYLKKLRPFTTRQVASKVNTSFASMWVVCILLFFAITTFGTGMALANLFAGDVDRANPYDASVIASQSLADQEFAAGKSSRVDVAQTEDTLRDQVKDWDSLVKGSAHLETYQLPVATYGDVMDATGVEIDSSSLRSQKIGVVGISQLNESLALQGEQPLSLSEGEYIVTNNMSASAELARKMAEIGFVLKTSTGELTPQANVPEVQLECFSMLSNGATIVVPDAVIDELAAQDAPEQSFVNVVYRDGVDADDVVEAAKGSIPGVTMVVTRAEMIEQAMGMRMMITYLALYIGLVLLVATAAVLAIQLLSLTIDSLRRYRTLSRLGCDMRMLSRSLFAQVTLYFIFPLAIAACHAGWTISLLGESLFDALGVNIVPSILMSVGFIVLIYGGYLLITYFASRATVKTGLKEAA